MDMVVQSLSLHGVLYLKCTRLANVHVDISCECKPVLHGWGCSKGWDRGVRESGEGLCRGRGGIDNACFPCTSTWSSLGVYLVFRRVASTITLISTVRSALAPLPHSLSPDLEHRAIEILCGEIRVELEDILEEGSKPPETVFN